LTPENLKRPVKIDKNGNWPITLETLKEKIDVAFIAMHGEYGEDGQIQSLLETFGIPYTGSDPIASALAINKQKSSVLFANGGLNIPRSLALKKEDPHIEFAAIKNFSLPIVIKPANGGSSIGVSVTKRKADLKYAIQKALQHSDEVVAQQYIKGREVTCGVLEINQIPIALLPTEIIPNNSSFFDYYSKYNTSGSTEVTPPDLPKETIRKIQSIALEAHKALGCSGMSRTDMILSRGRKIYVLETNTIPGLTETSLLPQQAQKMGINFPKLLEIIINSALGKNKKIYG
jgi:D-alanine-D-alanine ligase